MFVSIKEKKSAKHFYIILNQMESHKQTKTINEADPLNMLSTQFLFNVVRILKVFHHQTQNTSKWRKFIKAKHFCKARRLQATSQSKATSSLASPN
jgi:hypothetical protein